MEMVDLQGIEVRRVDSEDNTADPLTKACSQRETFMGWLSMRYYNHCYQMALVQVGDC